MEPLLVFDAEVVQGQPHGRQARSPQSAGRGVKTARLPHLLQLVLGCARDLSKKPKPEHKEGQG